MSTSPTSLWRTMALQASFNRIGLQRTGWWVALAPWLRRRDLPARTAWFGRQDAVFNTNPYLAPVLLGIRCRVEEDDGAELADRIGPTLQRTLGSLGDGLTWSGVWPTWFLALGLAGMGLGPGAVLAGWILAVLAVGSVHFAGVRWGYRHGLGALDLLPDLPIHAVSRVARRLGGGLAGMFIIGVLGLTLARSRDLSTLVAMGAAVGAGMALVRMSRGGEWLLFALLAGLLLFVHWTGYFPEAVIS